MPKTAKQHRADFKELDHKMGLENRTGDFNRARSVTVGTAFGGTTEIGMRCNDGRFIWALMQPVEVIELIHQLAANVGCHLQLAPRRDFSSWRDWRVSEEERLHLNGHPPFPNEMTPHHAVGRMQALPTESAEPSFTGENNDQAVAVERPDDGQCADGAAGAS
jgi:hypothetical protein